VDLYAQTGVVTVPTLRTERLVLKAPRSRDVRVVAKALNDFAVSRWLTVVPFPYGVTDAEWFINENLRGAFQAWFIWAGERFVGTIGLDGELGYWIAQDAWGQGYATEGARAVVDHHFQTSDDNRLRSGHFEENAASRRVLTKLGFEDIGSHTQFSQARQEDVAGRSMLLTRAAWDRLRTAPQ